MADYIRTPGLGSALCEFPGATPAAPHTLTMGIQSTPFPIDKGGIYAWSAWVYTETDANEGAVYGTTAGGILFLLLLLMYIFGVGNTIPVGMISPS